MVVVRVLHLITTLDRGGAENQLLALCRMLAARGTVSASVAYVKGEGELAGEFLAAGVPVARAPLAAPWTADRVLRAARPDLVHAHLFKAELVGNRLARRAGLPLVVTKHNEDPYLLRSPWRGLGRRIAARAARVVAISPAVERFAKEALGLPADRLRRIPYGLAPRPAAVGSGAAFRAAFGIPAGAPLAVAPARLTRQKGLDLLVEAARSVRARVPGARVVLLGRGEEETALRDLVRARGLEGTVIFAGFLPDPAPALVAADVVVLPSRWEGFGLAALEAMAAGRPVVAAAAGGLPGVLGDAGTLFPPGDGKALAEALVAALSPEAVAAARSGASGERGRRRAREEFSLDRAADAHESLYAEVLGRDRSRSGAAPATARRPARILLVARAGTGGAGRHVRMLLERLDPARFQATAAVSPLEDPAFPAALEALGARVERIPMERDPSPVRDLAAFRAVRALVRGGGFDLVHAHASKAGAFARLAAARDDVPVVYTPHGWYFEYAPSAAARAIWLRAERRLAARGGIVHCVSEAEAEATLREGIAPAGRIRTIPNAVPAPPPPDPARLEALRRETGVAPGETVFLMAARLAPPKDPLAFLAAAGRAGTRARFLLAGSGPLLEECRAAAGPRALVLGERGDVQDLLALADVAVLATRYDACPYFALEAAAAGRPLVAPAAAVPRALHPALAPFDPAEPASLDRALAGLIGPEAAPRRADLAAAARRAREEQFAPERWIARMEAMYDEVIAGTSPSAPSQP
jgi:glycosyltransferase involved in cell wall biosynthesis